MKLKIKCYIHVIKLAKKTNYDVKIKEMGGKYFTAADYIKFTSNIFDSKIKEKKNSQQIWYF